MKKTLLFLLLLFFQTLDAYAGSGDVNSDGILNVADIVEMTNYLLGRPSANFDQAAADVNNNGYIENSDVKMVRDLVLSGGNLSEKEKGLAITFDDGEMLFFPFSKELKMRHEATSLFISGDEIEDSEISFFQKEGYESRLYIKVSEWFVAQRESSVSDRINKETESHSQRQYAKGDVLVFNASGDSQWLGESQNLESFVVGYDNDGVGYYKLDFKNHLNENWTRSYKESDLNRIEWYNRLRNDVDESERQALVDFFNSTGGPNWRNNYGWGTDIPVEYWFGVGCYNSNGQYIPHVGCLEIAGANMVGVPSSLKALPYLYRINFSGNHLSGTLDFLNDCTSLTQVILDNNSFSGEYPEYPLSDLMNQIGDSHNLTFSNSGFSKEVPAWALNHSKFKEFWPEFCYYEVANHKFEEEFPNIVLPAPDFTLVDLDGTVHKSSEEYANHKLTILYDWSTWDETSPVINKKLIPAYNQYKDQGLNVIGLVGFENGPYYYRSGYDTPEKIDTYCQTNNVTWPNVSISSDNGQGGSNWVPVMDFGRRPVAMGNVIAINSNEEIVYQSMVYNTPNDIIPVIENMFGPIEGGTSYYTSTDYSQDGKVVKLQSATEVKSVDIVFIGEAFTDKDMASGGKYEQKMKSAMEQLFSMEPYTSLRNRFNVYTVKVVSPNAEFASDAIHAINEDNTNAFNYAKKALGDNPDRMLVCVIYNTDAQVGRSYCTMYVEDGSCVAYMMDTISPTLNHEFGGHGIAKLKDEYVELGYETTVLPDDAKAYLDEIWTYGAGANVDYHNNPSEVKWAHMISDPRYTNEVGIHEGAFTYGKGAYRPTLTSMMNDSQSPFNAPSREAIYKHVMRYSDPGWTFDFETFAVFDAPMRSSTRASSRQGTEVNSYCSPNHSCPPIIYKGSWRDVVKCEKLDYITK